MGNIIEMKASYADLVKTQSDLASEIKKRGTPMTKDEQGQFDKRAGEIDVLKSTISQQEETTKRLVAAEKEAAILAKIDETRVDPAQPTENPFDTKAEQYWAKPRITGQFRAFHGPHADEMAFRSGKWLQATVYHNEAAQRWCTIHGVQIRAQAEGINTAGGYLVPDEFTSAIIKNREQYGVFRQLVRPIPMSSDHQLIPKHHEDLTATFTAENAAMGESDVGLTQVELTAKKCGVLTRLSNELADDAVIDMADMLADEMAYAFAKREDQCGFIGDGSATYGGMKGVAKTFDDNNALAGAIDTPTANADLFSEILVADLEAVMAPLPAYALDGARWFCSSACKAYVFDALAQAAGGATMTETVDGPHKPAYLGYPIVTSQILPTANTSLDNRAMLLFGNINMACTFGERRGIVLSSSDSRYFEYDQIAIRATERFHIVFHSIGDNTNVGPLVGLIGTV